MRQTLPNETVFLLCKKCKHSFIGEYSARLGLTLNDSKIYTTKCPRCKSSEIMLNPSIKY